ncbi:hypothetical protein XENORESO_000820 [Xenotaenia resolanae]|uniref:Uncharacterized protein n=1 Tax=Xenotaenia resolanae TaxID=208358 RepID=A0ABV0WUH8_9TELE
MAFSRTSSVEDYRNTHPHTPQINYQSKQLDDKIVSNWNISSSKGASLSVTQHSGSLSLQTEIATVDVKTSDYSKKSTNRKHMIQFLNLQYNSSLKAAVTY